MIHNRIVALLGRRDEPTDGVADYCSWLGGALRERGFELEIVRVPWAEQGWSRALADLRGKAAAWRGCWVLLQFTNLSWSLRGFPLHIPRLLSILRRSGARCAVVFHDAGPYGGNRIIDRVRRYCQIRVFKSLYTRADLVIVTVSPDKLPWVSFDPGKAVLIPVGANIPEPPLYSRRNNDGKRTVAVFSVTGGANILPEVSDIGYAVKRAIRSVGPIRLIVMGRGSREAEPALRAEFSGTDVDLEILGLLSAEETSKALASADVLLFVRGHISTRRGSAIAGIACGLPVVCYAGPETAWPITEAGILAVAMRDREAISAALERVLADDELRSSLADRSRRAQERYFSWRAIADSFDRALHGSDDSEHSSTSQNVSVAASRE